MASQRLGLSAFGSGGQITQRSQAQRSIPWKWTSKGPRSNLEGGLVGGGRSLVRHATVCDEPFAVEHDHSTRPGTSGRVRLFQEDAQAIDCGKGQRICPN